MTAIPNILPRRRNIGNQAHACPARDIDHAHRKLSLSLWSAVAATAALRIAFAARYLAQQAHRTLHVLPFVYESGNVARALATGHGFASPLGMPSGPTAWVAPVYPSLLAVLFHLFGVASFSAFIAAVAVNIVFATLVCFPLYFATLAMLRSGHGIRTARAAAILACWLWALYPNAILLTYESMWNGCLSALLGIVLLWATLRLRPTPQPLRNWAFYGMLWGLVLLTNPIFLAVLPVLLLCLAWPRGGISRWRHAALALAVLMACILPWTVRNYRDFHALVPVRSDLGLSLWLGNNAHSTVPWHGQQHPLDNLAERARFLRHGEIPYMHAKLAAAVRYIASHPEQTAHRSWLRFCAFWSGGTPDPLRAFLRGGWMNRYVLICDLLFALAALGAIIVFLRRPRALVWALISFPLLIPCAYYLTEAIPRYRLAIDPELILLAACSFTLLHARLHRHPRL
ncbi:MAG: hypothetical protein ACRD1F_06430 [Terriglobales bacterium]